MEPVMDALLDASSALPTEVSDRLNTLAGLLRDMERVLVTFSGGVDSALLVRVAYHVLGEGAVALTAASPTFPPEELKSALDFCRDLGVRHLLINSEELEREGYAANAGNRCYFCKSELFDIALREARALDIRWVLDGTITEDYGEHRPGLVAGEEHQVRHPLAEAGFDKASVRAAAKALGVSVWDKPAFACLGSRFPVGTRVTVERVRQVQKVESHLRLLGLRQFRARWHELEGQPMVRLELDLEALTALAMPGVRDSIVEVCKAQGFRWVTVDLQGYQRGALSHALSASAIAPST